MEGREVGREEGWGGREGGKEGREGGGRGGREGRGREEGMTVIHILIGMFNFFIETFYS